MCFSVIVTATHANLVTDEEEAAARMYVVAVFRCSRSTLQRRLQRRTSVRAMLAYAFNPVGVGLRDEK